VSWLHNASFFLSAFPFFQSHFIHISTAPCGLLGCKNRPAPLRGRRSYQHNWLPGKTRLQSVEYDFKPYTLTHSLSHVFPNTRRELNKEFISVFVCIVFVGNLHEHDESNFDKNCSSLSSQLNDSWCRQLFNSSFDCCIAGLGLCNTIQCSTVWDL